MLKLGLYSGMLEYEASPKLVPRCSFTWHQAAKKHPSTWQGLADLYADPISAANSLLANKQEH